MTKWTCYFLSWLSPVYRSATSEQLLRTYTYACCLLADSNSLTSCLYDRTYSYVSNFFLHSPTDCCSRYIVLTFSSQCFLARKRFLKKTRISSRGAIRRKAAGRKAARLSHNKETCIILIH